MNTFKALKIWTCFGCGVPTMDPHEDIEISQEEVDALKKERGEDNPDLTTPDGAYKVYTNAWSCDNGCN